MSGFGVVLLVVLAICLAGLLSRRTAVPSPVLLVLVGLAVAALPGEATLELEPDVVLVLVLPPLLYSAALDSSLLGFRRNARAIVEMSVGLVLVTALVVGTVAHLVVPGLPWAVAFALGALVAPPDAVSAISIGRRVGMPSQLQTVIEGEGLLNDATSLVLYQVAVAAAVGGGFSLVGSGGLFLRAAAGGLAVGLAVAWALILVRRRLEEPLVENALSLATPFLAYLPAEHLGASGVLAVVVCGLVLGHVSPVLLSSTSRLQTQPVWRVVVFLLEGTVFLLIGLQLPEILAGLDEYGTGSLVLYAAVVVATVVLVRPVWVAVCDHLPGLLVRRRPRTAPGWRLSAALSWAGMRGVVSLAAAFALPLTTDDGRSFPQRDLVLFLVFVVILATLLGQGLTFGGVLRRLGLRPDRQGLVLAQAAAQQAALRAGVTRLDEVAAERPAPDGVAERLRRLSEQRANASWERLSEVRTEATGDGPAETPSAAWRRLRSEMLVAERAELVRMRNSGQLPEEGLREMQQQLDYEEAALGSRE